MGSRTYFRQSLGAVEEGFCLRTAQQWLYDKGYLRYQFVTGTMNAETSRVLNMLLGAGWEGLPTGACGLIGVLDARVSAGTYFGTTPGYPGGGTFPGGGFPGSTYPAGPYPSGYNPTTASMFGNIDPMAILLGVGVLGLVMLLKK